LSVDVLLDSSVPLALIFNKGEYVEKKVQFLFASCSGKCIMTSSIKQECFDKINRVSDLHGDMNRRFGKFIIEVIGVKGGFLVEDDYLRLQSYFHNEIKRVEQTIADVRTASSEKERIRALEYWTVRTFEDSFREGQSSIKITDFLIKLQKLRDEYFKIYTDELLAQELRGCWKEESSKIPVNKSLADFFVGKVDDIKDRANLSSAITLMYAKDTCLCLATLDYSDLIRNRQFIYNEFYLNVSDPMYIPYFLRKIRRTRGTTKPRAYARDNPTSGLKKHFPEIFQ